MAADSALIAREPDKRYICKVPLPYLLAVQSHIRPRTIFNPHSRLGAKTQLRHDQRNTEYENAGCVFQS